MQLEVELKFPLADLAAIQERLSDLGATFGEPIEQADAYFAHPCRDFKQSDEALRIRRIGDENFVTYKGPKLDAETKTRRELELPVSPGQGGFEQFGELLMVLGFKPVRVVNKSRRPGTLVWQDQRVELALDEVDGLGAFVELEILADETELPAVRGCLLSLAAELGLRQSERRGYLAMLLEKQGLE